MMTRRVSTSISANMSNQYLDPHARALTPKKLLFPQWECTNNKNSIAGCHVYCRFRYCVHCRVNTETDCLWEIVMFGKCIFYKHISTSRGCKTYSFLPQYRGLS
ncbi:hypothetical protein POVWA2_048390 [Plasmodium ovale wallikeri]|uniref:Uncharacterized protein n=1 Tax=Plasmodium ovale wallikeri TaxID=864142 RepID=A0A1A8ZK36_PLAOA|nr:hypothetical protein POVWA1_049350 [Plasmodium ovale wallikeri]SBT44709.1 hypothetical protein POVWA2_048390 [Plasmodium ovale wallikeri]